MRFELDEYIDEQDVMVDVEAQYYRQLTLKPIVPYDDAPFDYDSILDELIVDGF